MKRVFGRVTSLFAVSITLLVGTIALSIPTPTTGRAANPLQTFSHIMVMVLENQRYEDIKGNPDAPFINDVLIAQHASAGRFFTPFHNSPADYFALASGRGYTKGDGGDWGGTCSPSITCSTTDVSVFEQLNDIGLSWKTYSEDQDSPCQAKNAKKYWVGHNPAVFYQNLGPNSYISTGNGSCMTSNLGYEYLRQDIAANNVPELSFIIPNNCSNMHDACPPISNPIKQGDLWLEEQLAGDAVVEGGLINWVQNNDTLLIITFDESHFNDSQYCCPYAESGGGGHIGTWIVGPPEKVRQGGFESMVDYTLYSILKTVQQNWNLPLLHHANDPAVQDLSDFFPSLLTTSRSSGTGGLALTISGKSYGPNEEVTLLWDCQATDCGSEIILGTATTNADGEFSEVQIEIPEEVAEGPYAIGGHGAKSSVFAFTWYTVKPPLTISPTSGAHGWNVKVSGAGYGPNEEVTLLWDCETADCESQVVLGTATTDANGDFTAVEVQIPEKVDKGDYLIGGRGSSSGTFSNIPYQVTEGLILSSKTGIPGSTVTISGKSYGPNEALTLLWDCKAADCGNQVVLGTVTTDDNGDFENVEVTIPDEVSPDNYAIGGLGETEYSFAREWFKVKPPLGAWPPKGAPGRTLTMSGAGYGPDEEVALLWDCEAADCGVDATIGTVTTDANGEFSGAQIKIPSQVPVGAYVIAALGSTSGIVSHTTYAVEPLLGVSPASGAHGWNVKVSGAGYGPNEEVTLLWDCETADCESQVVLGTATTDANGQFKDVQVKIPTGVTNGIYGIGSTAETSQVFATAAYSVKTWVGVSPASGAHGWNVKVSGAGYGPNEEVTLLWDCETADCESQVVLGTATTDANGDFTAVDVQIPGEVADGDYAIGSRGVLSGSFSTTSYTVDSTKAIASQVVATSSSSIPRTYVVLGIVGLATLSVALVALSVMWIMRAAR